MSDSRDSARGHQVFDSGTSAAAGFVAGARDCAGGELKVPALDDTGFPQSAATVEVWFHGETREGQGGIFDNWDDSRDHVFIRNYGAFTPSRLQLALQPQSGAYVHATTPSAPSFTWQTHALTFDSAADRYRVLSDGDLVSNRTGLAGFAPRHQRATLCAGWRGLIDEVRVSRVARSPDWLRATFENLRAGMTVFGPPLEAPPAPPRTAHRVPGAIALYDFNESDGAIVHDTAGIDPPIHLEVEHPERVRWLGGGLQVTKATRIHSKHSTERLAHEVTSSDEFTVEVFAMADNAAQRGPARIATLTTSHTTHAFLIGQGDSWSYTHGPNTWIEGRARTTTSNTQGSSNGASQPTSASGTFVPGTLTHIVLARGSDQQLRLYLDGVLVANKAWPGELVWNGNQTLSLANEVALSGVESRPWLGALYLVAIYPRALGPDEVLQNFAAGP